MTENAAPLKSGATPAGRHFCGAQLIQPGKTVQLAPPIRPPIWRQHSTMRY